MIGAVWGSTFIDACSQLDKISNNYLMLNYKIISITKTKTEYCIAFSNGDIWRAFSVNQNRGRARSNIIYIQNNITDDLKEQIILPSLIARPYAGINYFN